MKDALDIRKFNEQRRAHIGHSFSNIDLQKGHKETDNTDKVLETSKENVERFKNKVKKEDDDLKKSISTIDDYLEKGKKAPIGTVSGAYKKVAEGKWQKVRQQADKGKSKKDAESDKKSFTGRKGNIKEGSAVTLSDGREAKVVEIANKVHSDGTQQIVVQLPNGGKMATSVGKVEAKKSDSNTSRNDDKSKVKINPLQQSKKALYNAINQKYDTDFEPGDIEEFEDDDFRKQLTQDDIKNIIEDEISGKMEKGSKDDMQKAITLMDDYLEKGGKRATVGEKRDFGGRTYIKTTQGWKYHGKGAGNKAKSHTKEASKKKSGSQTKLDTSNLQEGSRVTVMGGIKRDSPIKGTVTKVVTNPNNPESRSFKVSYDGGGDMLAQKKDILSIDSAKQEDPSAFTKEQRGEGGKKDDESTVDIPTIIQDALSGADKRYENEIKRLQTNKERQEKHLAKVKSLMPKVIETLKKQHLKISRFSVSKTGHGTDWKDDDMMKVSMSLEPTSGKVRFIKDQGYTSSGSGKNQKKLNQKADALQEKIKSGTGIENVRVNPYSFEDNSSKRRGSTDSPNTILVDLVIGEDTELKKSVGNSSDINKALTQLDDYLEKGKELPVGTERKHGGKMMVKTTKGWDPKKGDKKSSKDEGSKDKSDKDDSKGDDTKTEAVKEQFVRAKNAWNNADSKQEKTKHAEALQKFHEKLVEAGVHKKGGEPFWSGDLKKDEGEKSKSETGKLVEFANENDLNADSLMEEYSESKDNYDSMQDYLDELENDLASTKEFHGINQEEED